MRKWILVLAAITALTSCAASPPAASQEYGGESVWLRNHAGRMKALVYRSEDAQFNARLIIVLHGDAPFGRPGYQYRFARHAAQTLHNVVVAAILRPGYTDPTGDQSDGVRGLTTGDNYTADVIDDVANAAAQLQAQFHTEGVTLVGHSGGAAIAADVMERHAGVASRALLVSCPCDVPAWREHMNDLQHNPVWRAPMSSLSPMAGVAQLSRQATLLMVVGENDEIAPLRFTQTFANAAQPYAGALEVLVLPGAPHDILLEAAVMAALQRLEGQTASAP